jgi:putative transposase
MDMKMIAVILVRARPSTVDQDGYVLDEIVQTRCDTKAARPLLRRPLKKQGSPPRRMITDKHGS